METTKLTKQQKRDLKRNAKKISENPFEKKTLVGSEGTSVYKRPVVFPQPFPNYDGPRNRFIVPKDKYYQKLLSTCYKGFETDSPASFPAEFHAKFQSAMEKLDELKFYQFDFTQPTGLGTKLARTFVSRCLVGESGITYKYLGIRMFAYPWNANETGSNDALIQIGDLNKVLSERTKHYLDKSGKDTVGSCAFNLTLINRCFPESSIKLKEEPLFKNEKCTVSWHADSSLEHYSSIAVYHFTKPVENAKTKKSSSHSANPSEVDESWRLSLRVHNNAEGPQAGNFKTQGSSGDNNNDNENQKGQQVNKEGGGKKKSAAANGHVKSTAPPPIAIPLPSGSVYYLLDDFNHHHQHSVLAGTTDRYASTHRVSRVDGHTFWSIKARCVSALQGSGLDIKQQRAEQLALMELEFEWLRQFYIQGKLHYDLHEWWHEPLKELWSFYEKLNQRSEQTIQALSDAAELDGDETVNDGYKGSRSQSAPVSAKSMEKRFKRACAVEISLFDTIIEMLRERHQKREGWRKRAEDEIFTKVASNCKPMAVPFPPENAENAEKEAVVAPNSFDPSNMKTQTSLLALIDRIENWKERVSRRLSSTAETSSGNKKSKAKAMKHEDVVLDDGIGHSASVDQSSQKSKKRKSVSNDTTKAVLEDVAPADKKTKKSKKIKESETAKEDEAVPEIEPDYFASTPFPRGR